MKKSKEKIVNLTSVFVLLILAVIFIHSELVDQCHLDESHAQHDYCNIVSNSTTPQQNNIHHQVDYDVVAIPSIDISAIFEETNSVSFNNSYTSLADISRTILFESFLIWKLLYIIKFNFVNMMCVDDLC